ncbi:hypothetical protein QYE76_057406 [Lolium multiflorum]|uniref:Arabidopsis retrotransposon Orf1 C-terminal domain-containing protein n=1 Tax=Lolium multiflorum TaxID=4521 RepID=A0AAD8WNR9_LOLMU|nr:hypothetical protein QYE76_057406 [Lolium multiflorum]
MRIKLIRSSPYYAQANGQAEASNKSLIKLIKRKIDEYPRRWHEVLSEALWAYRMSCHGAVKISPYHLVYGQEAVLPWEITAGSRRVTFQNDLTTEEYAALMSDSIEDLTELRLWSLEKIKENKAKVARAYHMKVKPKEFHVGDLVWEAVLPLGTKDKAYGKWSPNWHGPYKEKNSDDAEELLAKIGRNHDDWTTPTNPDTDIEEEGMIKLNDEDMREAKKSLKEKGLLEDFLTLVGKAGLTTYVGDESEQYYTLTKIFVESFKFNNKHFHPEVSFKIYGKPITMKLEIFCAALGIVPVGTARRIEDNPKELLELYRGITNDDCRTIQRGKIRNIQLPAIKYFAYYIGTSILGRENTSNISSYHLGFLIAALTGDTPYHLGALVARRLSNKGPIFGGIIASRILAYLELPLDPTDVKITPVRLDIAAMKSHQFVTADSSLDNIVYRILFADGEEREILLPQPDLFIDRKPWSL